MTHLVCINFSMTQEALHLDFMYFRNNIQSFEQLKKSNWAPTIIPKSFLENVF